MADKRAWTSDEEDENHSLVHYYINEAYQTGAVDTHLDNDNALSGKKIEDGKKEKEKDQ